MATLLSFARPQKRGWSNDEKAQFARIQKLLGDAGVMADVEHGLTDEGDPWCVLCSGTSGDVIIHVARIDGDYLFDSSALPRTIKGRSLDDCAQRFIDDATVLARRPQHGSKIMMHPSALLAGVMLTIFLYLEAVGESSAQSRALLELDEEGLETAQEPDVIDVAEIKEEAGAGRADAVGAEEESPLLVLKQMLQQIAEAAQKQESDRTGQQGASSGQNWGATLLPSGAVVAAIAYAQDSIAAFAMEDEILAASMEADSQTDHDVSLSDVEAEVELVPDEAEQATVVGTGDVVTPDETETAEAVIGAFLLLAQAPAAESRDREQGSHTEPTALAEASPEDRFVFADQEPVTLPQDTRETVTEASVSLPRVEDDASVVSRLVRFMSESLIEIQDEVFDLGDFIEVSDQNNVMNFDAASTGITLPTRSDTLFFHPLESQADVVSSQDISAQITAFVKITGQLRYDISDRSNLAIYDHSIVGLETSDEVTSRSFILQDNSTVTFIGLGHELDAVFA